MVSQLPHDEYERNSSVQALKMGPRHSERQRSTHAGPGLWMPIIIVICVGVAGLLIKSTNFARTEINISIWLTQHQLPAVSAVAGAIATAFSSVVATIIAAITTVIIGIVNTIRRASHFLWVVFVSWGGTAILKPIVQRPRPNAELLHDPVSPQTGVLSYPSGHTAFATALFLAIALTLISHKHRRLALLLASIGIVVVAASRVYVGAHFMTDVTAGATASAASCWFATTVWTNYIRPHIEHQRAQATATERI
ncbi:MAG: phosphatase PAP2 family protein [Actinomycetaceae bacterium]|nr:phosphatase PAP2 family protein [Actinomycetaceae bacterium]